jgi:hypothetical protein
MSKSKSTKAPKSVAEALAAAAEEELADASSASVDAWHDLVRKGALKSIARHIDRDAASVNAQAGMLGPAALHVAADCDRADVAALLLDRGADINLRHLGRGGITPLHAAAFNDSAPLVDLLLARGANPLVRNHASLLPIDLADDGADCRPALLAATDAATKQLAKKLKANDVKALLATAPTATILTLPPTPKLASPDAAKRTANKDDDDDDGNAADAVDDAVSRFLRGTDADDVPSPAAAAVPAAAEPASPAKSSSRKKSKKKKSSRRRKEASASQSVSSDDDDDGDAASAERDKECVVCMAAERQVVITPCGHICMCMSCANACDKCPVCSGPKQNVVRCFQA